MRRSASRHDHSTQHLTDPATYRLRSAAGDGYVVLAWDYPGSTLLEVRILRSERGPALAADEGTTGRGAGRAGGRGAGQVVVYDDVTGSCRDTSVRNGALYHYTVFARSPGGEWHRWGECELRPGEPAAAASRRLRRRALRSILGRRPRRLLPAAALLLSLAALAAGAGPALAAAGDEPAGKPVAGLDSEARTIAEADSRVAAVLAGTGTEASVAPWGGTAEAPAGASVTYVWPPAQRRSVSAVWPLLASGGSVPSPPYATLKHRLRLDGLTSLRVDVLLAESRVLQVLPLDGETRFALHEETRAPFAWLPWFTARPWALAPIFIVVAAVVIARAWRRSRAWNRRLPSMTRHDRQFIGRLTVILFLLAGLAWQVYEAVYAARAPTIDPGGFHAGELAALPLLLFPPALFLAALTLELTPMSHRVAWGLVAVLAAAATLYNLAAAMTATVTTLNLTNYVLLGVLALLAAPRAFSAGRMGWSRNRVPRYT